MILCEFTPIGGSLIRCSMNDFSHIHLWRSYIKTFSSFKLSMPNRWGGYAEPTFSDLSFFPDMFPVNQPPPASASIKLMHTEGTDETKAITIFEGTAQLVGMPRDEVSYSIRRPANQTKIAASTAYNDTLVNVMTTLCGATLLNLTLDSSRARVPSPAVLYTTDSEQLTISLASDMCAFFSHGFYIENGTLHLVDMLDLVEHQTTIDEFSTLPCDYRREKPYSLIKSGDNSVAGSDTIPGGEELSISTAYHTTAENVVTALTNIKTIAERYTVELNAMVGQLLAQIAGVYVFKDESRLQVLNSIFIISDIVYNFDSQILQATGPGTIV